MHERIGWARQRVAKRMRHSHALMWRGVANMPGEAVPMAADIHPSFSACVRGALPRLKFLDLSNTTMGDAGLRTLTLTLSLTFTLTLPTVTLPPSLPTYLPNQSASQSVTTLTN